MSVIFQLGNVKEIELKNNWVNVFIGAAAIIVISFCLPIPRIAFKFNIHL